MYEVPRRHPRREHTGMAHDQQLKCGVIGAGMISVVHCGAYARNPKTTLVALADPIEERRKSQAARFGAKGLADYHDILNDESIQLVSVCTPDHTHAGLTIEALNAGKNVIVEKPMATNLEDCDKMIDAAKSNRKMLTVDFEYRYNPFFQRMSGAVADGTVGDLKAMSIYYWRHPFRVKPGLWIHKSRNTSMLLQESCHYVDIFRWICGDVDRVYAWTTKARDDIEFDQLLYAQLFHTNGVGSQYSHTILGNQIRHNVWLMGTRAALYGDLVFSDTQGYYGEIRTKTHKKDIMEDIDKDDSTVMFYGQKEVWDDDVIPVLIGDFIECIVNRTPFRLSAIDGRKAIELALALEESSAARKEVQLPLKQTPPTVVRRQQGL